MAKQIRELRRGYIVKEVTAFAEKRPPTTSEIAKILVDLASRQGAKLNVAVATDLYQAVVELIFRSAIGYGRFRFPPGWGGIELRVFYPEQPKMSITPLGVAGDPNRRTIFQHRRPKVRYTEGAIIKELLGTKPPSQQRTRKDGAPIPSVLPEKYLPPTLSTDSVSSPEPTEAPDTDTDSVIDVASLPPKE